MKNKLVIFERQSNGIILIKLHHLSRQNMLDEEMLQELQVAFSAAAIDREAKVMVMSGLPEVFCAGGSKEMVLRLVEVVPHYVSLVKSLLNIPFPTIAAMEGHAMGGGLAFGLSTDIVLMARESRYAANFMNLGFTPGMGTTGLLEYVLSPAIARELMFTGEYRKGADFIGCSGVNYILPRNQIMLKAMDLAERIAEKPRLPLEILKRHLSKGRRAALEESITAEAMMHMISASTGDMQRMVEENYLEG